MQLLPEGQQFHPKIIYVYEIGKCDISLTVLSKVLCFPPIKELLDFTNSVKCCHWKQRSARQTPEV